MNWRAVWAIYRFEMARTGRTIFQSIVSPVISTSLYFVVFGAAIGSRIPQVEGVGYGAFIVPGLIMMMLLTQSVTNASFGIYFPRFVGTIFEILSAPVSAFEIVLGYVGAAATKSIVLGLIILATAGLFVPLRIAHPVWMLAFLVLTAVDLQPVRLHHRALGGRLREAADHPAFGHHAADVPRRQLLLDQRAAAVLAGGEPRQSDRLSDLGLPLELLRGFRRQRDRERRDHRGVSSRLASPSCGGSSRPATGSRSSAREPFLSRRIVVLSCRRPRWRGRAEWHTGALQSSKPCAADRCSIGRAVSFLRPDGASRCATRSSTGGWGRCILRHFRFRHTAVALRTRLYDPAVSAIHDAAADAARTAIPAPASCSCLAVWHLSATAAGSAASAPDYSWPQIASHLLYADSLDAELVGQPGLLVAGLRVRVLHRDGAARSRCLIRRPVEWTVLLAAVDRRVAVPGGIRLSTSALSNS